MKLEATHPQRSVMMIYPALLDLLMVLIVVILLGQKVEWKFGTLVELPRSVMQLSPLEDPFLLEVTAGDEPNYFLDGELLNEPAELIERLQGLAEVAKESGGVRSVVVLRMDEANPVRLERAIVERLLAAGYQVALQGSEAASKDE